MWSKLRRKRGSAPQGMHNIVLYPSMHAAYFYQEKQSYPWPPTPAHETRAALSNCWTGNQLPGPTNFIPNVWKSGDALWNVPTSYANTLRNQQFNSGFNIHGQSAIQNAALMSAVQQAWQNRTGM